MNIGFIGGGVLTEAIVKGLADNVIAASQIFVSDHKLARADELRKLYHINAGVGSDSFIKALDILVLAVKPQDALGALAEIKSKLNQKTILMSVVAGLPISSIELVVPERPIVRAMPNIAISVGEGMTALSTNGRVDTQQIDSIKQLWRSLGRCIVVDERLMNAVTGLSGSAPAFAFLMLEALSDGGVAAGLPRGVALELAAQTMIGTARLVLDGSTHPAALRDKVTSPAGTTVEGIRVLERNAVRSAFIEAVVAASEKSEALSR